MKTLIIIILSAFLLGACDKLGNVLYEPPVIESFVLSPDEAVLPGDTIRAIVVATNPEKGILSYKWEAPDGGQFIPPIDRDSVKWIAPLQGGDYGIRIVVKNDDESKQIKHATVLSLDKPYVKINSPANNDNFIVGDNIEIGVSAYHDNQLSRVLLLVQDSIVDSLGWNSSDTYTFLFTPDSSHIGPIEIKVTAEAAGTPGNTNSDYINIFINSVILKSGN